MQYVHYILFFGPANMFITSYNDDVDGSYVYCADIYIVDITAPFFAGYVVVVKIFMLSFLFEPSV